MDLSELKRIGLTSGEIKVYSALLDLGETTRTKLSRKSGVSPSKIYDVAGRLLEKGIISCVKKDGVIHFCAANPEQIRDLVSQKEEELRQESLTVDSLLPMLLAKYNKAKEHTDVEVMYGWQGMKVAYDDLVDSLGKGEFNFIFGASKGQDTKQADVFFNRYYKKKAEKGFGTKIIFNEVLKANKARVGPLEKRPNEIRYMSSDTFAEINTYRDTVLIVLLLKQPMVIKIRNHEAADSFKSFFYAMWKGAKRFKPSSHSTV